ncbi:hypothetical protein K443DRAFT_572795 [Laccaria amethystina LaAM-08-1]|uniref:Uncharacterized protein n=1 Tax=Laccaria amethystina LaAM-08-1 TaxID=1095629 RepID=A0A0C9WRS5_9AGAR|nr:hypothetical protein K443DRAFT_572795 [Laccaria amethystina LaAM-08-1]
MMLSILTSKRQPLRLQRGKDFVLPLLRLQQHTMKLPFGLLTIPLLGCHVVLGSTIADPGCSGGRPAQRPE